MLEHPQYTRKRIAQLVDRIKARIYPQRQPVDDLQVAGPVERIGFDEAQQLTDFKPARIGDQFGPPWATFWFRAEAAVPNAWRGARVDLLWDSQSEATLWRDGRIVQGLNMTAGDRPDAILCDQAQGGERVSFQIEMACNNKLGVGEGEHPPQHALSPWHLRRCEIARFDEHAWRLYWDARVLHKLELELARENATAEKSWQGLLLYELNRFANTIDLDNPRTWSEAHAILRQLYDYENGGRMLELSTIGHAHIDTAWLWPLAETRRKCARSFSSALAYMRDYPEYRFACSQAYQYDLMRREHPDLYEQIKQKVRDGQWVPVGGTWIEPDCNIPSGESLCRQFLLGQRYFEREFGKRCREFWNPDVFGYNGQLPQIMRQAGISRFLTQKLSWNQFNPPHHHTFTWRGIDGSEVLAHFPPANTYNALVSDGDKSEITELRDNIANFKDHLRSHHAIILYGFGDGGGGPTKGMLEVIRRTADLQGLPRTAQRTSDEFFDQLEQDATDRHTMVGELYFEYHRGTYTSQALCKKHNRRAEQLLHDAEYLAAAAQLNGRSAYPRDAINALWQVLLLNQFHDILPGSSIQQVYIDSARQFEDLLERGESIVAEVAPPADTPINTIGFERGEVIERDGRLDYVEAPPYGAGQSAEAPDQVRIERNGEHYVLSNAHLRAELTPGGRVVSLIERATGREALADEAHVFELYDDRPTNYDAWDVDPFHLETRQPCAAAESCNIAQQNALRAALRFDQPIGEQSRATVTVRLDAASRRLEFHVEADWRESHKTLKVAFPVNAHAPDAAYQMQFGHTERPTHYTTSYDLARFEVPMHHWCDLSETGFGVALLNDCKYGGSTFDNVMRLTLLRAPKSPDPECDMGRHTFAYALMPHADDWRNAGVVAEGYRFNQPLRFGAPTHDGSLVRSDEANLVIDTVKCAEDENAVVLRVFECHGARGEATVTLGATLREKVRSACRCNVLEDDGEALTLTAGQVSVPYQPHEVIGVKLRVD